MTVLICTRDEADNLPSVLPLVPSWVHEVLVIDGNSVDGTPEVVKALCPRARVVVQPGHGKGDAIRFGLRQATGDIVVMLDGDGQTNPAELARFVQPLVQGYDLAKGSRFRRPFSRVRPLHRVIGNWAITLVFDMLFLKPFTDVCSGYNAFRREAILRVDLGAADGLADEPLINARAVKAGLRIIEVPHYDLPRISGVTKAPSWRQGLLAIRTIIGERLRSASNPL